MRVVNPIKVAKLTCKETIRLICEYLDGTLSSSVVLDVEEHLGVCPNCRIVLEAARKTLLIYFDSEPVVIPPVKARVA